LISGHPNIVAFVGYFQEPNGMALELCDGMLSDLIFVKESTKDSPFMQIETMLAAAIEICSGCEYIQKFGVVHYDLKAANVLFKKTESKLVFKVADFGASTRLYLFQCHDI
jgi:serine/threonine protein kinase